MDYEQISAFLGGTVGTLIIKAIFDYFGKNRDHKQHLQKLSYERKLQVGEAAIAFWSYYRYNVVNMRSGLKATIESINHLGSSDDDIGIGTDLSDVQASMVRVGAAITSMFGDKYQEILSMNLYFDFPDSKDSKGENITDLFTALGQAKATDNDILYFVNQANIAHESRNIEAFNFYNQQALDLLPSYKLQLESVLYMLDKDVINTIGIVNSIKKQFKLY